MTWAQHKRMLKVPVMPKFEAAPAKLVFQPQVSLYLWELFSPQCLDSQSEVLPLMVLPSNLFSHSNNEQKRRASAPQSFFDFRQMKIASLGFSHSEAPGKSLCHNQIFTSGSELLKKVADVLLTQKGKVNERYAVLLNPDLVFIRKLKPKKNRNESIFYFTHSLS